MRATILAVVASSRAGAHATIIVEDYFQWIGTNVSCNRNVSPAGSCSDSGTLALRSDLREALYVPGCAIAESQLSPQRALDYMDFRQPEHREFLPSVGFSETKPNCHEWIFAASGFELAAGESCNVYTTLGFSFSYELGLNKTPIDDQPVVSVPEPGMLARMGAGLIALAATSRCGRLDHLRTSSAPARKHTSGSQTPHSGGRYLT